MRLAAAISLWLFVAHVAICAAAVGLTLLMDRQLRLRRHDQAVIMLSVLKIILRLHAIAAGMCVTRQLEIFFVDMRWRAPDFHIRTVRIHCPPKDVLRAVLILVLMLTAAAASSATPAIVTSPAALTVLLILSWSHEHCFLALIQICLTCDGRRVCRTPAATKERSGAKKLSVRTRRARSNP